MVNASAGRVHLTRYTSEITLELAQASQADHWAHWELHGRKPVPTVLIPDKPFPLPGLDVRTYWRQISMDPGFEGLAAILPGVVGLMAASLTSFGEQLVGVLGVNVRSFRHADSAAEWMTSKYNCGVDEFELMEVIDEVLAYTPDP